MINLVTLGGGIVGHGGRAPWVLRIAPASVSTRAIEQHRLATARPDPAVSTKSALGSVHGGRVWLMGFAGGSRWLGLWVGGCQFVF